MIISKERLDEFKRIWKRKFGEDISDEKAQESGSKLIQLVEAIYKPMTQKEYDKFSK